MCANGQRRIAVLIPCYNEALTIGGVVRDFRAALPDAAIHVYDNNSTDGTAEAARQAGAICRRESIQGKGAVVRRMFADIEADVYVLVDGDGTYHAPSAPDMVRQLAEDNLDMVIGRRVDRQAEAYRPGHRFGNQLLTAVVAFIFGRAFRDMLSGYRVFSRRFVKSFPVFSRGFQIETEMAVHALEMRAATLETDTPYGARPEGSHSKLNTYRDGLRILLTIVSLLMLERPRLFFGALFGLCALTSVLLGLPLVETYLQTGLVPRLPTAVLCSALMILAFLMLCVGLILDHVAHGRLEAKMLAYLALDPPSAGPR